MYNAPSLLLLCLHRLSDYPDQLSTLKTSISLVNGRSNILDELGNDASIMDPRLWAVVIQVFSNLPDHWRTYTIAFQNEHLPLLQYIPSSERFALITVLELPSSKQVSDDWIVNLKHLHALAGLDLSMTSISSFGISRLANTLIWSQELDQIRLGPWNLRILDLRGCQNVDSELYKALGKFPLLCLVGMKMFFLVLSSNQIPM
jgi:hypothetical protein